MENTKKHLQPVNEKSIYHVHGKRVAMLENDETGIDNPTVKETMVLKHLHGMTRVYDLELKRYALNIKIKGGDAVLRNVEAKNFEELYDENRH